MGGKPSKGTRKDRRLKANRRTGGLSGKPSRGKGKPFGTGSDGDGRFPI